MGKAGHEFFKINKNKIIIIILSDCQWSSTELRSNWHDARSHSEICHVHPPLWQGCTPALASEEQLPSVLITLLREQCHGSSTNRSCFPARRLVSPDPPHLCDNKCATDNGKGATKWCVALRCQAHDFRLCLLCVIDATVCKHLTKQINRLAFSSSWAWRFNLLDSRSGN